MATKTSSLLMLTFACLAISAMSRIILPEPEPQPFITGRAPNIKPDDFIHEIAACWSSLMKIPNCVADIYREFLETRGFASPACCQAISNVTAECWPKMFIQNPVFPSILLQNCNGASAPAPQPLI